MGHGSKQGKQRGTFPPKERWLTCMVLLPEGILISLVQDILYSQ